MLRPKVHCTGTEHAQRTYRGDRCADCRDIAHSPLVKESSHASKSLQGQVPPPRPAYPTYLTSSLLLDPDCSPALRHTNLLQGHLVPEKHCQPSTLATSWALPCPHTHMQCPHQPPQFPSSPIQWCFNIVSCSFHLRAPFWVASSWRQRYVWRLLLCPQHLL